jgi:hypothetical protein
MHSHSTVAVARSVGISKKTLLRWLGNGRVPEPYASMPLNGHVENWPLKSRRFRQWLLRRYYDETKGAPKNQAVQEAIGTFESKANFEGPERFVFMRLAEREGRIYLDLSNTGWEVVEIDADGWRVVSDLPVMFRRARGMSPLPYPVHGGCLNELRRFVNVASETDWILLLAWLVAALRPRGPYPILVLHGEQGSAKSTTSRVLRALLDPNTAPLRGEPRELRDVMIAASNGWVISLDNLLISRSGYLMPSVGWQPAEDSQPANCIQTPRKSFLMHNAPQFLTELKN